MLEKVFKLDIKATDLLRMDITQSGAWKLVTFLAHSGDSWFWITGLALVWVLSRVYRPVAAFLILAIVILAVVVLMIKRFVRRRRPDGEWGAIYRTTDPHSFPSGHAARAAMLALFAVELGPIWLAAFMILWALAVSISRVMTGMHYLSDILAGLLLGLASGALILLSRPWLASLLPYLF